MYNLVVTPAAIQMANEAYEWYEEQQPGLGNIFLQEVERCFNNLESQPASYAVIKKNYRQVVLKTFPYVIVFEIMHNNAVVFCVFHSSRNPRKKFTR